MSSIYLLLSLITDPECSRSHKFRVCGKRNTLDLVESRENSVDAQAA